jgi:hypothetical protein
LNPLFYCRLWKRYHFFWIEWTKRASCRQGLRNKPDGHLFSEVFLQRETSKTRHIWETTIDPKSFLSY